jgi:drug/metabolite transporter (DMT)-like permease
VSNNITFIALGELSPAMFNLLMNFKILVTGIEAYWLLSEPISRVQWKGLALMFVGSAVACIAWSSTGPPQLTCSWLGLLLMLVYSFCSGSAAVAIDFITRHRFRQENIFVQNVKFSALGVVANVVISICRGTMWSWNLQPLHMWAVLTMVMNGLMTAAVIKYAGSLVKTFASSFATFPSALVGYLLWNQTLGWNYYVGAVTCTIAVNMYAIDRAKRREH